MARINNSQTIKRIMDDAGIQTSQEDVPSQLASKVVPVLVANPEGHIFNVNNYKSTTGSRIVHTTSLTKDTYLIACSLAYSKDGANTGTTCVLKVVNDYLGDEVNILEMVFNASNLDSNQGSLSLCESMKLKRGSDITTDFSYGAGTGRVNCSLVLKEMDTTTQ